MLAPGRDIGDAMLAPGERCWHRGGGTQVLGVRAFGVNPIVCLS
uniref:Uncharacterized protein n=1 Tax=Anguilla anguilla TaxID=7936 RepID=A0A0E9R7E5_ANGAN